MCFFTVVILRENSMAKRNEHGTATPLIPRFRSLGPEDGERRAEDGTAGGEGEVVSDLSPESGTAEVVRSGCADH
jgi:hypothetical protein